MRDARDAFLRSRADPVRFKRRLCAERSGLTVLELDSHHGFALAVREGLHGSVAVGSRRRLHTYRALCTLSAVTLGGGCGCMCKTV